MLVYICYVFASIWIFFLTRSLGNFVPPALDMIRDVMDFVALVMLVV
eukprot:SAG31_NODE_42032_length_273_cov_0.885057_1_plen_46_part_01